MFTTNYVKNDHPAYCAGIQTLNLLIASLTPWPLDQGSRPQKTYLLVYILDHSLALSSWLLILPMMGLHTPVTGLILGIFIKGFIGTWILLQASMSISFGTVKTILIYSG